MKFYIFNKSKNLIPMEGKVFSNGITMGDVFMKMPVRDYLFGNVIMGKFTDNGTVEPIIREQIFADRGDPQIEGAYQFIKGNLEKIIMRGEELIEKFKKGLATPSSLKYVLEKINNIKNVMDNDIAAVFVPLKNEEREYINIKLFRDNGGYKLIKGMVDTGSKINLVDPKIIDKIKEIGEIRISGITGTSVEIPLIELKFELDDETYVIKAGVLPHLAEKVGAPVLLSNYFYKKGGLN
ncbi:MAG: hypothetical protein ACTSRZ_13210 [Promethearchaeota archaeon]